MGALTGLFTDIPLSLPSFILSSCFLTHWNTLLVYTPFHHPWLADEFQIEALDEATQTYKSVSMSTHEKDPTIPPLKKYITMAQPASTSYKIRLTLYLDKDKPLSEPKWVKTGDIEDWLKSISAHGGKLDDNNGKDYGTWSGKIAISDPDPVSVSNIRPTPQN